MPELNKDIIELNSTLLKIYHKDIYDNVLKYVEENFEGETNTFREKLYIYVNELTIRPTCKWCNSRINFWKFEKGYKQFCSNDCSGNFKKALPQEIKDITNNKRKETTIKIYGVENVAQVEEIKEKFIGAREGRYEEIEAKKRITFEKNWGSHPLKNKDKILERSKTRKETMNNIWINDISNIVKEQYEITKFFTIERKVELLCKKCNKTTLLNSYTIRRIDLERLCKHCNLSKDEELLEKYRNCKYNDIDLLSISNDIFTANHISKNHIFEINRKHLYDRAIAGTSVYCTICSPIGHGDSSHQKCLKEYLDSYNIQHIYNEREILNGKHLDFYIPSHNLAIEINGVYWHNETRKSKYYHLNKTIDCQKKGIELLHIFEDDWISKQDIVKSIILNKLGIIENKIYARKCVIKEVNVPDSVEFLDENHIQGSCRSQIKIGLYYNNELVSLMTFGYRKTNRKKEFELIRFCNKINTNIIGASSKLFKYFLNNYKIEEGYLISYSDLTLFNGKMYEMLDFKYIHLSDPNYYWVISNKRRHRWEYNLQKLIKEGFDPEKTEVEIMHDRGYFRIWGCGLVRWEYHFNK